MSLYNLQNPSSIRRGFLDFYKTLSISQIVTSSICSKGICGKEEEFSSQITGLVYQKL